MSLFTVVTSDKQLDDIINHVRKPIISRNNNIENTNQRFIGRGRQLETTHIKKDFQDELLGFNGHRAYKPYCVQDYGRFGDIFVSLGDLNHCNILRCTNFEGKIIINKKVSPEFVKLITISRIAEISDDDILDFQNLVKVSKIKARRNCKKYALLKNLLETKVIETPDINAKKGGRIMFIDDGNELVSKFQDLVGHKTVLGNDSPIVSNGIMDILDELLKHKQIDKIQHLIGIKKYVPHLIDNDVLD